MSFAWGQTLKPSLELPGPPHRGQKRACEPHVDVPEAPGRATRACNLRGIARTSHFRCACLREVCRGSSDDDLGGPITLPHAICEGLWPSSNPPWSFRGLHIGVRKRACEPHVDVPEAPGRATRACNLRGIARTSHFRGACLREVCRGSSDDDFGGPVTLPHAICEGSWRPMALPHAICEGSWPPRAPDLDCVRVGPVPSPVHAPPMQNRRRRSTVERVMGEEVSPTPGDPTGGSADSESKSSNSNKLLGVGPPNESEQEFGTELPP